MALEIDTLVVRLSKLDNFGRWSKFIDKVYYAELTATTESGYKNSTYKDRTIPDGGRKGVNREKLVSLVTSHLDSLISYPDPITIEQLKLYTEKTFFPVPERQKQDEWQVWEFARVIEEFCKNKKINYDHQYNMPREKVFDVDFDFSPPPGTPGGV
jgi:hypothetical protein|tara:strand:- start:825 stop:1292 length:468 start_codon:yes stop_codon:yes gene_type:complete